MACVNYPDLTIFEDFEVNFRNPTMVGFMAVVKPSNPLGIIGENIHDSILLSCKVYIQPCNITQFGWEWLVKANSRKEASVIFREQVLFIDTQLCVVCPWTPEHGSYKLLLDASIPSQQTPAILRPQPGPEEPCEPLKVFISGMPPNLFGQQNIIARMFSNILQFRDLMFYPDDLTISFNTYAPRSVLPSVLHVGVRTKEGGRYVLHIWDLVITVQPLTPAAIELLRHPDGKSSYYTILIRYCCIGLTIVNLAAEPIDEGICYKLYPAQGGNDGGPSGQGGAHGVGHQQLSMLKIVYTLL
jgi:hypothetical protein